MEDHTILTQPNLLTVLLQYEQFLKALIVLVLNTVQDYNQPRRPREAKV